MGLLGRSIEIVKNYGLGGYLLAIKRYLLWHPVADEIWWRVNRLVSPRSRVIRYIEGYKMLVDTSKKGIHQQLLLYGCHELESTRVFSRMLPANARVADIGSNIGYYVLLEAQVAQKVYAIEPEPQNLELLKRNIELNSYGDRVEVHELALSDTIGKTWLSISDLPNQHRIRPPSDVRQAKCIEVATTTLDEFLKDKEVDVIRMDLEGAEWLVVHGMTGVLRENKPLVLFIEVHPELMKDYGGDARTLLNILLDSGFHMRYLAVFRPSPLLSLGRYVKPRTSPQEQVIECHAPQGNPFLDKNVNQILDESIPFRLFMERPRVS